jgi:hypothetical protein
VGRRLLILLVVVGPAAWLTHLLVSYGLVYVSCSVSSSLPLHLTTVAAVAAVVMGLVIGRRRDRDAIGRFAASAGTVPEMEGGRLALALGRLLAWFFLVVIVMAGVAALVVGPCL